MWTFIKISFTAISLFISTMLCGEETTEDVFQRIYENRIWGTNKDGEGHSGPGSTYEATKFYRAFLQDFLKHHHIHSVVDAGCGDWEFSQHINWDNIRYFGYDVVPSVIEKNITRFETPTIQFFAGDFTTMDLPSCDLLICKDVLMHLPHSYIFAFLSQIKKFKYCIFVNDVDSRTLSSANQNINIGEFNVLDLTKPPFWLRGSVYHYKAHSVTKQILVVKSR